MGTRGEAVSSVKKLCFWSLLAKLVMYSLARKVDLLLAELLPMALWEAICFCVWCDDELIPDALASWASFRVYEENERGKPPPVACDEQLLLCLGGACECECLPVVKRAWWPWSLLRPLVLN